ncbi:MAG TPA: peptidylprolyl isomerase [Candidatus Acidoferrales bacterium]|nr:peptidylprolyl isomerase [Candidatus Acidoferrales bacterium]
MKKLSFVFSIAVIVFFLPAFVYASGSVVEQIIARVNNDMITMSDYQKAENSLQQEAQQDCQGCTPEKINEIVAEGKKNLLRDLIDQSLLVQRAKDMDISVETDVVKRLDTVRQQNKLDSMDALQKAVESQGISWEDYKDQLRNSILTQRVISEAVGSTVRIGSDEVQKYYDAHKNEFVKPEGVDLSVIFFSTENKTPQEVTVIQQKAEGVLKRLKSGDDFAALAKRFSEGPSSAEGGELGSYKRGELTPDLEKLAFSLKKGDITDVIPAPNGLQILRVNQHFDAGLQPLSNVEQEVENDLYQQKIQPAMRKFLTQLRKDSYVVVKAGYTDSGGVSGASVIQEVPYSADQGKKKKDAKAKDDKAKDTDDQQ